MIDLHKLELPHWLFNFTELRAVLTNAGASISNVEAALLNDLVTQAKRQFLGSAADERTITSDTPTPYRIGQVADYIEDVLGRLDKPESIAPYQALKTAIVTLQNDARFGFMFAKGVTTRDLMVPILSLDLPRARAGQADHHPRSLGRAVRDPQRRGLRAVPHGLRFRDLEPTASGRSCWCARRPISTRRRIAEAGFEPTKRVLSRIAKEGRKYGLSLRHRAASGRRSCRRPCCRSAAPSSPCA